MAARFSRTLVGDLSYIMYNRSVQHTCVHRRGNSPNPHVLSCNCSQSRVPTLSQSFMRLRTIYTFQSFRRYIVFVVHFSHKESTLTAISY